MQSHVLILQLHSGGNESDVKYAPARRRHLGTWIW